MKKGDRVYYYCGDSESHEPWMYKKGVILFSDDKWYEVLFDEMIKGKRLWCCNPKNIYSSFTPINKLIKHQFNYDK